MPKACLANLLLNHLNYSVLLYKRYLRFLQCGFEAKDNFVLDIVMLYLDIICPMKAGRLKVSSQLCCTLHSS